MNTTKEPPAKAPWGILAILLTASVLSFVDRQILSLLVDPIKHALKVDDFAMGLLAGPAFAIFYAIAGLPLGWLADRTDRGRLMAIGIAAWSLMTVLSGFAGTYWHLFIARIGVGVGEATLGPSAFSLIADRFDRTSLPMAMSLYSTGVALGAGLAFTLGGQVVALAGGPAKHLLLVGALAPWQLTFVIVGLPGLLVALMLGVFVRDPRVRTSDARVPPFAGLGAFWAGRRRLIVLYCTGVSLLTASGFASLVWLPSYFIRRFGWTSPQIGTTIGVMLMVLGVGGVIACGVAATRLARSGMAEGPVIVAAAAAALSLPATFATVMPSAAMALILIAPGMLVSSAYVGLGPAIVQSVTPPDLRGRVAAIALMLTGLIGMVLGPVGVGAITTFVFGDPGSVGTALMIVTSACTLGGAVCLWAARAPYRAALAITA